MTRRSKQVFGWGWIGWLVVGLISGLCLSLSGCVIWKRSQRDTNVICSWPSLERCGTHNQDREITETWLRDAQNTDCLAVILEKREGVTPSRWYTAAHLSTLVGTSWGVVERTLRWFQSQRSWAHTLIVSLQGWVGEAPPQILEKGPIQAKKDQQSFSWEKI